MPQLVPIPKKCNVINETPHAAPLCIYNTCPQWEEYARMIDASFNKCHRVQLQHGIPGGIEIYADETLPPDGYRVDSTEALKVYASDAEGLCYGLSTALQLANADSAGFSFEAVQIEDRPDKEHRALMIDLSSEWHPFRQLLKFVDICFINKVKYLQLHFIDNERCTLPFRSFPKLCREGQYYTREQLQQLRQYAKQRGVIIIPEFECPGHAGRLIKEYPEVFENTWEEGNVPEGEHHTLCIGKPAAWEGVCTMLQELVEMFPDEPYIHIGGDEPEVSLWENCTCCKSHMEKNGLPNAQVMFSNYIGKVCDYVLSLGKTPMVWEGFLKEGSECISRKTIVVEFESLYQMPQDLLDAGFRVLNASWKPLYILPGINFRITVNWDVKNILDWNVYNWQHWLRDSDACLNPVNIPETDQIPGAMLCAWGTTFDAEIGTIMIHLSAMSERVWTTKRMRSFEEFSKAACRQYWLTCRLIQDLT